MSQKKKIVLLSASAALLLSLAYFGLWPVKIEPELWTPPPPADAMMCAAPAGLENTKRIALALPGPEAIAVDVDGSLVTGLRDGRIVRVSPDGSKVDLLADTKGRPLGIKRAPDGRLVVADGKKGILAVAADGAIEVLATEHEGARFGFPDDLDVAQDGTIYFTDASTRWAVEDWKLDIVEHGRTGRLFAWRPDTKKTELLVDGLSFANGVALSPDESYVAFTELNEYALKRYWLRGDKKGKAELLALLPGFPDNVTLARERGLFWVAIGSPRDATIDSLSQSVFLRKLILRLPAFMQPKPKAHSFVVGVDESGKIVRCLQHIAPGAYAPVASAVEKNGSLYLGSFREDGIGVASAPPL